MVSKLVCICEHYLYMCTKYARHKVNVWLFQKKVTQKEIHNTKHKRKFLEK